MGKVVSFSVLNFFKISGFFHNISFAHNFFQDYSQGLVWQQFQEKPKKSVNSPDVVNGWANPQNCIIILQCNAFRFNWISILDFFLLLSFIQRYDSLHWFSSFSWFICILVHNIYNPNKFNNIRSNRILLNQI